MQHEGRDAAEQNGAEPHRSDVEKEADLRVAARTEHADNKRGVHGLRNDEVRHDEHHEREIVLRLRRERHDAHQDGTRDEYDPAADQAENERQADKPSSVFLRPFRVARADGLADHDGCGVCDAEGDDRRELAGYLCDAVCGYRRAAEMADDDGVHRRARAPQQLVDHHGHRVGQKVAEQQRITHKDIADAQAHRAVDLFGVDKHNDELHKTGADRRERRTLNSHRGEAEQSEDKHSVEGDVCHKRDEICYSGDDDALDAAHDVEVDVGQRHGDIGDGNDAQIFHALGNNVLLRREDAHKLRRNQKCRQRKDEARAQREAQCDAHDFFNGARVAFAPILRRQNGRAARKAEEEQRHDELDLPGERGGGEHGFAHLSEHHDVCRGDGHIDEVLQRHRHHKCKHVAVKDAAVAFIGIAVHKNRISFPAKIKYK